MWAFLGLIIPANRSLKGGSHYITAILVALQTLVTEVLETGKGHGSPHVVHVPLVLIRPSFADIDAWPQRFTQTYNADHSNVADDADM